MLATARNRVNELNALAHPEIELAHWAAVHVAPAERARTTLYTTGEHCPMCAAAHGWVGLGKIVYLSSAQQLMRWLAEVQAPAAPIWFVPVQEIIPGAIVAGPADGELLQAIKGSWLTTASRGGFVSLVNKLAFYLLQLSVRPRAGRAFLRHVPACPARFLPYPP